MVVSAAFLKRTQCKKTDLNSRYHDSGRNCETNGLKTLIFAPAEAHARMDNKALKIGIISGIISSLLVIIFINPILSFVWRVTVAVAGSVHQGYVDRLYRDAAMPDINFVGLLTYLAVLEFGFMTSMFTVFNFRFENFPQPYMLIGKVNRYGGYLVQLSVLLLIIGLFTGFSIVDGISRLNASFTQRLTVLAPAINDTEYKTLRARWASMQSKADYDAIVIAMDKRAKELSITLPPVRVP